MERKPGELFECWEGDGGAGVAFHMPCGGRLVFVCELSDPNPGYTDRAKPADWELAGRLRDFVLATPDSKRAEPTPIHQRSPEAQPFR